MLVCTVLVLATATATVVEAQAGKDPLLLEYSDYYYDLYYGDYSYDAPGTSFFLSNINSMKHYKIINHIKANNENLLDHG